MFYMSVIICYSILLW